MTIEEVRQIWLPRAQAVEKKIMDTYRTRRDAAGGGYGHEGLGVHGIYKERAAREKVRMAVRLLEGAGLEVSHQTVRKVTGQSESTIASHWPPPKRPVAEDLPERSEDEQPRIIRFPFPGGAKLDP